MLLKHYLYVPNSVSALAYENIEIPNLNFDMKLNWTEKLVVEESLLDGDYRVLLLNEMIISPKFKGKHLLPIFGIELSIEAPTGDKGVGL